MNRRSFLVALGLAPVMPVVAAAAAPKKDPGFTPIYCMDREMFALNQAMQAGVVTGSVRYSNLPTMEMEFYPSVYQGGGRLHRCFDYREDSFAEQF